MPSIYKLEGEGFELGLWKITETADFFRQQITYRSTASNAGVYLQQMASRFLLNQLSPGFLFDDIVLNESGKPLFAVGKKHFSLTHTNGYTAAIVAESAPVGIDLELISDRVLKVENKFLNEQERRMLCQFDLENKVRYATLCWSIKETVYKWWGKGGVDFSAHINIIDFPTAAKGNATVHFLKNSLHNHSVACILFGDLWLTYMIDQH